MSGAVGNDPAPTYDSAGNTTEVLGGHATYNDRGRLVAISNSVGTSQYIFNALGERISKVVTGLGTTLFVYDESHHLLGEYASSGALIEETVWMDDIPVATLRPSGSSIVIYYVHTDHLNSVLKVSQPSSNKLAYRWDPDAWGAGNLLPNQNPSGLGTFVYNITLPGMYLDAETKLFQNYFRDYSPFFGRYGEADPIGLAGGINNYAYVRGNPLSLIDNFGLAAHLNLINANTSSQIALYNWGEHYQPDNYNTILVHGTDDGQFSPNTSGPIRVSPEVMADELEALPGYDPNIPTELIACTAGAHPDSVQRLANALNATVLASPQTLVSNPPDGPPLAEVPPTSLWASILGLVTLQAPTWIPFAPSHGR